MNFNRLSSCFSLIAEWQLFVTCLGVQRLSAVQKDIKDILKTYLDLSVVLDTCCHARYLTA